jgi:HSP20 family protein
MATGEQPSVIDTEPQTAGGQRVPVNMYETDEALVVVAPMPGVRADDVEIIVGPDELTLRAELRAPAATKRYVRREWEYGDYERTVPLPPGFTGSVSASLGNGQLAVSISRHDTRGGDGRQVLHPTAR